MLAETLAKVLADVEQKTSPASAEAIAALQEQVRQRWKVDLPSAYLELLRTVNGIVYNGLIIYGAGWSPENRGAGGLWQGLIAANEFWHELPSNRDYLVFGDTDMDVLALHLPSGQFARYDRVSHDEIESYGGFDAMLEDALKQSLG